MRRSTATILAVAALGLSACGNGDEVDLQPIQDAVDALDDAQADLRSRMSEIEQSLTVIGASNGEDDGSAAGVLEQLATLQEGIDALRTDLTQLGLDVESSDTEVRDLIAQLEATLNGVSTTITTLRNDLASLREDHELLRQRFERHLQDHN